MSEDTMVYMSEMRTAKIRKKPPVHKCTVCNRAYQFSGCNECPYCGADQVEPKVGEKWDQGKQSWFLLPLELIEPLAEVMVIGEIKGYGNFSCLDHFDNWDRRFYDGAMRHQKAAQRNPLAINTEYMPGSDEIAGECYHLACEAFNCLVRLYHARKSDGSAV